MWPDLKGEAPKQFLLNGKPVFINGIAGYEHALGKSHAFTAEEIATRVAMIKAMGFNGFRDAHQPHNLRFQYYWDHQGVLWWPQFSAHIWFDTPAFRENFLRLLKDWVLERRNSPSNIMWGLQNESKLPADFARQCVDLIRRLDPTASGQRLITTCNGGEGTDWNVPQNWSGTYGGDPDTYNTDLKKEVLVGEYGGWRTMGLHTDGGFNQKGPYSIESWCALLEKKIRLANAVKDSVCGQFLWLFNSHDNPGREQAAEGYRDLDKIGPVNYKGLLTSWEEPTEAFYLYAANFTSAASSPMVHIAGHDWAERWTDAKSPKDISVYSNCDSVVLYNGEGGYCFGKRMRKGIGTHFSWNKITPRYNVLYAVGYYEGRPAITDEVHLNNLPDPPFEAGSQKQTAVPDVLAPVKRYQYLYRYNCGGPAYTDHFGNKWSPDRSLPDADAVTGKYFGSLSWTADYKGLPAYFASQRFVTDPVKGTADDALFQTFRYGRDKLKFVFPVKNGRYVVQLFFVEPWWGNGSQLNCTGWRDFDVAVNGKIVLPHLDIFKEAGSLRALKKEIPVEVTHGEIRINFPDTYSGQAVISAIAIATDKGSPQHNNIHTAERPVAASPEPSLSPVNNAGNTSAFEVADWLHISDELQLQRFPYEDSLVKVHISGLPAQLFGTQWLRINSLSAIPGRGGQWKANGDLNLYVGVQSKDSITRHTLEKQGYVNLHQAVRIISRGAGRQKADSLVLLQKDLKAGELMDVDAWWGSCLIAFKPVSQMQPPYDQKPEFTFGIKAAIYEPKGQLVQRDQKDCFLSDKNGVYSVIWPVVTGVADFHSFQVKYANAGTDSLPATLSLIADDGAPMASKEIWLTPTRQGKWNSSYLTTPTMINAGHYRLKFSWKQTSHFAENTKVYIYNLKLR